MYLVVKIGIIKIPLYNLHIPLNPARFLKVKRRTEHDANAVYCHHITDLFALKKLAIVLVFAICAYEYEEVQGDRAPHYRYS